MRNFLDAVLFQEIFHGIRDLPRNVLQEVSPRESALHGIPALGIEQNLAPYSCSASDSSTHF